MKEEDVRPKELFDELLRLNREDVEIYFSRSKYLNINCPACDKKGKFVFNKNRFNFEECESCKTLYVSPRPDKESFDAYYSDSESSKFWATTFYKATEQSRREKIWKPKTRLVSDTIFRHSKDTKCLVDIGGGYGVFMEEFLKINDNINHLIIEPSKYLSDICRSKNMNVLEKFLEDLKEEDMPDEKKAFVSFELFEHLHDPRYFLESLFELMNNGDTFIFTTLSGMGVDIRTLWSDSKAVSPPMHLNFLNPKSTEVLLKKVGFEILEISTPGELDIDIMNNSKEKIKDRYWRDFLEYSSESEKYKMQKFIRENLLSSHMMVACQKG